MRTCVLGLLLALTSSLLMAADDPKPAGEIVPRDWLVIKPVGRGGRTAIHLDAIEAQMVAGKWQPPKAGEAVRLPDGTEQKWEAATAMEDGNLDHAALRGGYAFTSVTSDAEQVMILEASGHGMGYVNGEPRAGDPYRHGYVRLPALLRKGSNDLLFHCPRGGVRAKLTKPKGDAFFDLADVTAPDLIVGERVKAWVGLIVVNATDRTLDGLTIQTGASALWTVTPVPAMPPLSTRKVAVELTGNGPGGEGTVGVPLELVRKDDAGPVTLSKIVLELRARLPSHTYKRTFRSDIDGSVQYYAVNPARPSKENGARPALFLTLHGAGVEATGQADAYTPKSWGHLVAATNRRPFGFDWEDWGRLDAMEVLAHSQKDLRTDPQRTYLTGHSMGGHGVWHLGATFPDRFAAIGPSAGWISFATYGGGRPPAEPTPMQELLLRSASPSNTPALVNNYGRLGVYVLHGDKDDNVPVGQARAMKDHLSKFHRDFEYHEQPGAGHWWDASDEHGTDCVDWGPMFDYFSRRVIPARESVRQVEFTTANPAVSAWCHWAGIEAQIKPLEPSTVRLRFDPGQRRFAGTTENVARIALDLAHLPSGKPVQVELDGQKIKDIAWQEKERRLWLKHEGKEWAVIPAPSLALKGPHRSGPFKDAFRNRMLFVYGTVGTAEENAWALAKARYDAETFWYRGNGSVDVIPDTAFDPTKEIDRNVILYGNADSNKAWKPLLAESPVRVERGKVRIGERTEEGADLACLFIRPRPGSDRAVVGVVSGTGLTGMRLTDRIPVFVSGVGVPDCVILGPDSLTQGSAGVRAAGFFGPDWSVGSGEFVWQK